MATLLVARHGLDEQRVGLAGTRLGHHVVGVLVVDGIDLVEVDELLDVDRVRGLGVERGQLVGVDHHVLARRDLVALDDLVVGHFLVLFGAEPLLRDAGVVGACSWLKRTSWDDTAVASFTGTFTRPKLIEPLQMARGMCAILRAMSRTVFSGGKVFDGSGADPAPADLVIEDSLVVGVGPGLDGDESVDVTGKTLLPGLFDCYAPVDVAHRPDAQAADAVLLSVLQMPREPRDDSKNQRVGVR